MSEFERLLNDGDEAYTKGDYSKAVLCYEDAFKLVTDENKNKFQNTLPKMSSCYRQIGSPRSVIELASEVKNRFGRDFITSVFYTTIAAAYADMREFGHAHKCVDEAKKLENGKVSKQLQMVIDRIEK